MDKALFNDISIHAPPRGATDTIQECIRNVQFQFTPLREGRRCAPPRKRVATHFNSRPSARGDLTAEYNPIENYISIHAPPRGATCQRVILCKKMNISIHAPPRGATCFFRTGKNRNEFQFTPLREGRPGRTHGFCYRQHFNSRPSARGDRLNAPRIIRELISIHAPPRGATITERGWLRGYAISIHAPPRGATMRLSL